MSSTTTSAPSVEEEVVLLDDDGRVVGTASKASVHGPNTPLHLAFSCYVFDRAGNVLVTRRALGKRTWPGVWTNSFCGHPAPGEDVAEAVVRRADEELGVTLHDVRCVLPDFRYRAVAADGTVENEVCPVFCAWTETEPAASPAEVMEHRWVPWDELRAAADLSWAISPWATAQIPLLEDAGVPIDGQRERDRSA
ncbi:isopentenyl-diphosphate Delta-isomerase [Mycolicibacterium arenosum]|uniref:Isopentenyl-diphosphate Delta-isomerase n=1 Tax=Mycolicibacterium arenosum TaxID=2952157 RepID=A0ABT1LW54_9MYCO|nr:isopentenyl-diphosphate Delta-isomerase [Mycolicibacterium sp. CAU 1645]MCP9270830.1 isopentenyl-diphosphate Delta-isomerase [Mycolicibacterium sp. CAU 1645]